MSDLFDSVAADVLTTPEHAPFGGTIVTAGSIAAKLRERLSGGAFWKTVEAWAKSQARTIFIVMDPSDRGGIWGVFSTEDAAIAYMRRQVAADDHCHLSLLKCQIDHGGEREAPDDNYPAMPTVTLATFYGAWWQSFYKHEAEEWEPRP